MGEAAAGGRRKLERDTQREKYPEREGNRDRDPKRETKKLGEGEGGGRVGVRERMGGRVWVTQGKKRLRESHPERGRRDR